MSAYNNGPSPIRFRDYRELIALWKTDPHIRLSGADSPGGIRAFLRRNRGLSLKYAEDGEIVAALLCGHDGRRGYFHHLFVRPDRRRRGLARILVERCLSALRERGIEKAHIFVLPSNEGGQAFWRSMGFYIRPPEDVLMYSKDV